MKLISPSNGMLLLVDVLNISYFLQPDHFSNVRWNLAALLQQTGGEDSLVLRGEKI